MRSRAWAVWAVGVSLYTVAVLNRCALGVAAPDARDRLAASASQLALFGVIQLVMYAGMQVPVGVLLDRWGARRVLTAGGLLMTTGGLVLAAAESVPAAALARGLVGAGDAMVFISVIRASSTRFPSNRMPLMTQLTAIVGQLGQVAATYPLIGALSKVGWTSSFATTAALTLAVTLALRLVLAPEPIGGPDQRTALRKQLKESWGEPGTRLGFWVHFTTQFSGMVFVLLWGYPFLVEGNGLSPAAAGGLLTLMVPVGIATGVAFGAVTGARSQLRLPLAAGTVTATAATWTVVLVVPGPAPAWLLGLLCVALATNVPASMLGIDFARMHNPRSRQGTATGMVNAAGFVAALVTMGMIGLLLDALPQGSGFRTALAAQYLTWTVGVVAIVRGRRAIADRRRRTPLHLWSDHSTFVCRSSQCGSEHAHHRVARASGEPPGG